MAEENTALIALGLDTVGFQKSLNDSDRGAIAFTNTISALDSTLRSIPLIGRVWGATFGQITQGFAEAKLQAREFSQILATDVTGSLEGTEGQIDRINKLLGEMRTGSFSRAVADFFKNFENSPRIAHGAPTEQEKREGQEQQLVQARIELEKQLTTLYHEQATARSTAYSQSLIDSQIGKITLDAANKKAEAERIAFQLGGPERAKWDKQIEENLQDQLQLISDVAVAEEAVARDRIMQQVIELNFAKEKSRLELEGNERQIAAENRRRAEAQLVNSENFTDEEKNAARIAVEIAKNNERNANLQYEYVTHQAELQAQVMDAETRGQTRLANVTKIRSQYENEITRARQQQNYELERSLTKQRDSAILAEKIREYELGPRGRENERRESARKAQETRIIEARERTHQEALRRNALPELPTAGSGQRVGMLPTYLYRPANLGRPESEANRREQERAREATSAKGQQENFMRSVIEMMGSIQNSLRN